MLSLHHVVTPQHTSHELADELYRALETRVTEITPTMRRNFSSKGLNLEGHLVFSVLKKDNVIVACAGIYNGGRYPDGVYRILNRTFLAAELRSPKGIYSGVISQEILSEQLKLCQGHLNFMFVSRQGLFAGEFMKYWRKHHAPPGYDWQLSDGFVHVAPGYSRHSYQQICYAELKRDVWAPAVLDQETWLKLEVKNG